jgi:hypothetical protein
MFLFNQTIGLFDKWICASCLDLWNPQNDNFEDILLLSRKLCKANFVWWEHIVDNRNIVLLQFLFIFLCLFSPF